MHIVIKIPKEKYDVIKSDLYNTFPADMREWGLEAIRNGTPLPKGHGDLKDTEKLKHAFAMWSMAVQGNFTDADIASIIYNSPTIIPADKGEN